jgi:hypothetical protein
VQHAAQVASVCDVCAQAAALEDAGTHVVSCDEKTGIQALERAAPTLPTRPGKEERREYEYVRHGTLCLMANLQVATGRILAPSVGPTRSEVDFALHVEQTVATDPTAGWLFVVDNLTTHCSESLVRWVAKLERFEGNLGKKGSSGILENVETRRAFLVEGSHRVRFVYTPKHCSWLNQIECCLCDGGASSCDARYGEARFRRRRRSRSGSVSSSTTSIASSPSRSDGRTRDGRWRRTDGP